MILTSSVLIVIGLGWRTSLRKAIVRIFIVRESMGWERWLMMPTSLVDRCMGLGPDGNGILG